MVNPIIDCLFNHRSIRKFKDGAIEQETMETILKAGTRAATGGNLQLYSFVVIDDPKKMTELRDRVEGLYPAPAAIIVLADQHRPRRWMEKFGTPPEKICNNKASNFFLAFCDAMIALQNVVVAAESLGLGTCYIGGVLSLDVQDFLGAPEHVFPAGMIVLGYPDQESDLSIRLPLDAVVHYNNYRVFTDDEIAELYEERNGIWDVLPDSLKENLRTKRDIHNIPQGVAARKYSEAGFQRLDGSGKIIGVAERSRVLMENISRAKFEL